MVKTLSRDRARSLLAVVLASVSALALNPIALSQSYREAQERRDGEIEYDIPAQPLSAALLRFADQSGLQIVYSHEEIDGLMSRPLLGRFTPEAALAQMLPAGAPPIEIVGNSILRVSAADLLDQGGMPIDEEVIVTGTRIRGAHPAGSNLTTITRDDIDETGRSSVQEVLQILPQNFPGSQNDTTQLGAVNSGRNVAFASTVDLRGLGPDATLTLLNGRRLAPAGFGNFVDISTIPLAAVQRIDVLADGASALYGSDAVAGVVNIVLRRDFEGAETALRYGAATRGDPTELNASQLLGARWASGNAMIGYEYRERTALAASDRWFSATSDLRPWGGSNFSSTFTNPGNIIRIGATNVVIAIPEGQDGTSLAQADLLPGVVNYRPFLENNDLVPAHTSQGLFAHLRQELTPELQVFFDVLASRRESQSDRFQNNVTLIVPETNAYRVLNNLFPGQGPIRINYNMGADLGPSTYDTQTDAYSLALGGAYALTDAWRLEANVALSHHQDDARQTNVFAGASFLTAALASNDLDTAFNPFSDGGNSPAAALQGLTYSDRLQGEAETITYTAKLDGPLFEIWGGTARVAFGIERRDESFALLQQRSGATNFVGQIVRPSSRTTDAAFGELFLPLVGGDNTLPGMEALTLSMSLRYEDASDFGSATTPKIGLTWVLDENLALRASWGESFKAPQFQQLGGNVTGTLTSATSAQDPFATNGSTGILLLAGGNSSLRPETAENWTAGFDFTPRGLQGFRLHATYFDIDFVDRISDPGNVLAAFANPVGFEGVFIRNPTQAQIDQYLAIPTTVLGSTPVDGIEAIWDGRLTNLASLRVRGVDLEASYAFATDLGDFQLFANASLMLQYTRQANAGSAPIDALDTMFNPVDLRVRAGAAWSNENWGASLSAIYVDDYRDEISAPSRRVESWLTWDMRITRDLRSDNGRGAAVSLSIQNLFDEDPPFANNPIGYAFDPQAASPIGRFIAFEVRQTW